MKRIFVTLLATMLGGISVAQNVGINTISPDPSAALHIDGTDSGLLIPRLTQSERNAISDPANGLLVYQTDNSPGFYYNSGTDSSPVWVAMGGSTSGGTGSGASVFGDGDSELTISSGTVDWTTSPPSDLDLQYSGITIGAGATLRVPSGTKLRCNGNVVISGTIEVAALPNTNSGTIGDKGIGKVAAAVGSPDFVPQGISVAMLSSLINIPLYGGGSGAGGSVGETNGGGGGGSFAIYASGNININVGGIVSANGENAVILNSSTSVNGSGGGGGGLIVMMGENITVNGVVQANGGSGSDGLVPTGTGSHRAGGGGGGGGVICFVSSSAPAVSGAVVANGGAAGTNASGNNSSLAPGGNGGASGGNGGVSSNVIGTGATAGSSGIIRNIVVASPANLY